MIENQGLIDKLQKLMAQKKSKRYYAERLGISTEQVNNLLEQLRNGIKVAELEPEKANYISLLEEKVLKFDEDIKNETAEITANLKEKVSTLEELIEKCNIDTKFWNIDRYIQNYWGSGANPHWQVKAWLSKKTPQDNFHKNFIEFLKNYSPKIQRIAPRVASTTKPKGCLIINKQDQHLNKFDIGGENSLEKRFQEIYDATELVVKTASLSSELDKVYYIIGSDQFNAEWTGTTTRGTKMENVDTFHNSFEAICNHELNLINMLGGYAKNIEILYVSGNHDEHVGWHLISWLKAFCRFIPGLKFDTSPKYRKYARYGNTAVMFNHGDAIKPPKLANIFPIEFREEWSKCENFYIFTGDKHHEVTMDFNGIIFFQLPALSKSKSSWDDKNGHTCSKAQLVAFVIDEKDGMVGVLKRKV